MNRADIADHARALTGVGKRVRHQLYLLTLQNANEGGVWDVQAGATKRAYLKALGCSESEVHKVRDAVEELKRAGLFSPFATTFRPCLAMPDEVLARQVKEKRSAHRANDGTKLPDMNTETYSEAA